MPSSDKKIPKHIGIIIDQGDKWAKERNLGLTDGFKQSLNKLWQAPSWFFEAGVEVISVLLLNAKAWDGDRDSVNSMLKIIKEFFESAKQNDSNQVSKILFSGALNDLPGDLPEICLDLEHLTQNNSKGILNICLNYSGHLEFLEVCRRIIKNGIELDQIHEGMIKKYLCHGELPDIELIVQTGEQAVFPDLLSWQSLNSELTFIKKYWSDFEETDVVSIVKNYLSK